MRRGIAGQAGTGWLALTERTTAQNPDLDFAYKVAERAAGHPDTPQALGIVAGLLGAPLEPFHLFEVMRHADDLLRAAVDSPQWRLLQKALINAGEVKAAFISPGQA